jgi:hypothetical protein
MPFPTISEHEAAALLPAMSETEFSALVEDIRENGLREPIVLYEGKILDGRHRMRACEQLGLAPLTKEWDGKGAPEAFVASMNLHRRHLTISQRAMIAAKMATLKRGQKANALRAKGVVVITTTEAAKVMGVHKSQLDDARIVLAEGTTEEIAAVNAGQESVTMLRQDIRAGLTPKERAAKRSPAATKAAQAASAQTNQMKARIYGQVRDGITALSTLPRPPDVVRTVKTVANHDQKITAEIINRALVWLTEFSNEWSRQTTTARASGQEAATQDGKTNGTRNHNSDPGHGNGVAGAEWPKSAA